MLSGFFETIFVMSFLGLLTVIVLKKYRRKNILTIMGISTVVTFLLYELTVSSVKNTLGDLFLFIFFYSVSRLIYVVLKKNIRNKKKIISYVVLSISSLLLFDRFYVAEESSQESFKISALNKQQEKEEAERLAKEQQEKEEAENAGYRAPKR